MVRHGLDLPKVQINGRNFELGSADQRDAFPGNESTCLEKWNNSKELTEHRRESWSCQHRESVLCTWDRRGPACPRTVSSRPRAKANPLTADRSSAVAGRRQQSEETWTCQALTRPLDERYLRIHRKRNSCLEGWWRGRSLYKFIT